MLIEIPDPEVILSVIIAFLIGLGGLFAYYKLRPMIKTNKTLDASQSERLEYYERQLIDMKIRLDSIEIQGVEEKPKDPNLELKQFLEKLAKNEIKEKPIEPVKISEIVPEKPQITTRMPNLDHNNATNYVLQLITNKAMTSRDIQITLKRSREHTSRLMKKLFEDGYVKRNTNSKPYSYSISEKGKERINVLESNPIVV
jgi:predicted HTH transcriptional regulator